MTDTADTGVFDSAIQRARIAIATLREQLAEKVDEIGQEINTQLDEVQTAIEEIQNAWAERGAQPDNTLPGDLPPEPTQLPADQGAIPQPPAPPAE